jgi:hypothetical protein
VVELYIKCSNYYVSYLFCDIYPWLSSNGSDRQRGPVPYESSVSSLVHNVICVNSEISELNKGSDSETTNNILLKLPISSIGPECRGSFYRELNYYNSNQMHSLRKRSSVQPIEGVLSTAIVGFGTRLPAYSAMVLDVACRSQTSS